MEEQKSNKLFVSTIILVVVHLAGVIGLSSSYSNYFSLLTPVNLFLSTVILFINHKEFNKVFIIFAVNIFIAGFVIELIGVRTGLIFGNYNYGSTLGFKIFDIPLIIGLNWLMLTYSVGVVCNSINNILLKSLAGASLLVILDFLIEPVAIKYNFWLWADNYIPVQNYIAWFAISFIFLIFFNSLNFNKSNKIALSLYIIQLVFFALLNI